MTPSSTNPNQHPVFDIEKIREEMRRQQMLAEEQSAQASRNTAEMFGSPNSGAGSQQSGGGMSPIGSILGKFMNGGGAAAGAEAGAGAGAGAGAAAGSTSGGAMSGLSSLGGWGALAAAILAVRNQAVKHGWEDKDDMWKGKSPSSHADHIAPKMNKIIPGLGDEAKVGADLATLDFSNAFKHAKKGVLGRLLSKL